MYILNNRTSWSVTLNNRTHLLTPHLFNWGDTPSLPTSLSLNGHSLLMNSWPYFFLIVDLFSDQCTSLDKAQSPICIWACVPTTIIWKVHVQIWICGIPHLEYFSELEGLIKHFIMSLVSMVLSFEKPNWERRCGDSVWPMDNGVFKCFYVVIAKCTT